MTAGKICPKCLEDVPRSGWSNSNWARPGNPCRKCKTAYNKKLRHDHPGVRKRHCRDSRASYAKAMKDPAKAARIIARRRKHFITVEKNREYRDRANAKDRLQRARLWLLTPGPKHGPKPRELERARAELQLRS
jgi:hypothetical protein